jgi:hypothetical protein
MGEICLVKVVNLTPEPDAALRIIFLASTRASPIATGGHQRYRVLH